MTNGGLGASYLRKAADHLEILSILHAKGAYSNVVREAQEIVELALKGVLRLIGIDPPKWHDVSSIMVEHSDKLPDEFRTNLDRIVSLSRELRRNRELSFYGDIDCIPTEVYTEDQSRRAMEDATFVVDLASRLRLT